jgi:hypothetical protein
MLNELKKNRDMQRLTIEVLSKDKKRNKVQFKFVAQTLRGKWFGDKQDTYDPENGMFQGDHIALKSNGGPELDRGDDTLYVMGTRPDLDDTIITCSHSWFDIICADIKKFNMKFRGSPNPIVDNFAEADKASA